MRTNPECQPRLREGGQPGQRLPPGHPGLFSCVRPTRLAQSDRHHRCQPRGRGDHGV